jgi:transglutaminase-like putative cysteine protease
MPIVSIRHLTRYRYRTRVGLGEHRMMLRPLEAFDQRLLSYALEISPQPSSLHHLHDLTDACVTVARFDAGADALVVESRALIEHAPLAVPPLAGDARLAPGGFAYAAEEAPALAASTSPRHPGEADDWARRFVGRGRRASAIDALAAMTRAIRADLTYEIRPHGPAQTPAVTLERGRGSCRDFALLLIEAARSLGLAARFVSGYVYGGSAKSGRSGHGHTHAWARVYLPPGGWVDFDPTHGTIGSAGLIRVAVAPDARMALPLHGVWRGRRASYIGMDVEVDISAETAARQPPPLLRVAAGD